MPKQDARWVRLGSNQLRLVLRGKRIERIDLYSTDRETLLATFDRRK